jgi:hypothetical protein
MTRIIPAIRKSDVLLTERRRAQLARQADELHAAELEAAKPEQPNYSGWWYDEPEGLEDEGHREAPPLSGEVSDGLALASRLRMARLPRRVPRVRLPR